MAVDEQQLRTRCIYEAQGPLGALLADVQDIGRVLDRCHGHRRKLRWMSLFCLIAAVVCMVGGIAAASSLLVLVAILAFAACIGSFIYSFIYSRSLVKHANRHGLLRELLGGIQQDAHAKAPFSIRLSMASHPQLLSEESWTVRKKGKQAFFKEQWLTIAGPLLDGADISEDVTELSRKRTYVNPRGKWKTKTRSRYLLTLRFGYPKELYGDARPAHAALQEQVRTPPSAAVRGVRVTEKAIAMKALVGFEGEIAQTAGMLSLGAYRILNLARRAAPNPGGGTK